jgi:hypothetical protein
MDRKERCETCRWSMPCKNCRLMTGTVQCRRHPPAVAVLRLLTEESARCSVWPHPMADDWCGEWQPTPPAAVDEDALFAAGPATGGRD